MFFLVLLFMHVFLSCGDASPALTSRRNAVLSYSMRLLYLEWSASGLTTVFMRACREPQTGM